MNRIFLSMKSKRAWYALAAVATGAGSAQADPKIDILSGLTAGHQVRCTSTRGGGGSIDDVQTVGQNGRVSFLKHEGYDDIYYMDLNTGKTVCDMGTNGNGPVVDAILIGDIFPLFAAGSGLLTTTIDLTRTMQGLNLQLGDGVSFSEGSCPAVPGVFVLDDGVPFNGTATVGGFNTVAPTPGSLMLLGLGGLCGWRRRRLSRV